MGDLRPDPRLLVEPGWLARNLGDPRVHVIDCTVHMIVQPVGASIVESGRPDYERDHIPGAHYLHMVEDLSDPRGRIAYALPSVERIEALLRRIGVDNGDTIVLYGATLPQVVTRAWWVLTASGAEDVRILDGGWKAWVAQGFPRSAHVPTVRRGSFSGRRVAGMLATLHEVRDAMARGDACLLNALTPEQFAGTGGAHYGRPGRIPGSVNVPNRDLVDPATGRYRPLAELAAMFERAGALRRERIIAYCGGGIAATGAAFALALLGHRNVAVYDGSLLEWAADPALPMVTG